MEANKENTKDDISNTTKNCNTGENLKQNVSKEEITGDNIQETTVKLKKEPDPILQSENKPFNNNLTVTSNLKTTENEIKKQEMDNGNCDKNIEKKNSDVKEGSVDVQEKNTDFKKGSIDDEKNRDLRESLEEDIPESFFDDLMSEDFIEGLNVVDTWEGDDVNQNSVDRDFKENKSHKQTSSKSLFTKNNQRIKGKSSSDRRKRSYKRDRDSEHTHKSNRSHSKNRELKRKRRSRSRSKGQRMSDSGSRRDPSKTQRDILRDKDKCERDKTAKILHEKLKVVETGLVPPGMEMEIDIQNSEKTNKSEEREVLVPLEEVQEKKKENKSTDQQHKPTDQKKNSNERKKDRRYSRISPHRSLSRKDISPNHRREIRRIRSRSRSPQRRVSPRVRSRSMERRLERRRRSPRHSRSRSRELRSISRELKRKYKRKTSPLIKRNQKLFKELDMLKASIVSNLQSPSSRNIEHELLQKQYPQTSHTDISNINMPQNYMNNAVQFPSVMNQNYAPAQPVPPPHQPPVELDQQFFIGQPSFESSNYQMPMQPMMMHSPSVMPLGPPEMQHNYQQTWHVEQPIETMNFYHHGVQFDPNQNNFQGNMGPHTGYMQNTEDIPRLSIPPHGRSAIKQVKINESEEGMFAKLFADNKITLSDYLSVSAKSTDNSNPVDIQNKIKVISHCQEALSEINGSAKATGRFCLRKSQKGVVKPTIAEGLTPFKKVPVIKFQFTTFSKLVEDKLLAGSLNRLLNKLGKEALFQDALLPSPLSTSKLEHKEVPKIKISTTSSQTDPVSTSDFGCQVSPEDIPSPAKSILKKQSLAQLTPAQLLAQAQTESSPPPAPKWSSQDYLKNRRNLDDVERRNARNSAGWSIPSRTPSSTPSYYDCPPAESHHYGNRHQNF